jgi:hypothetical protein
VLVRCHGEEIELTGKIAVATKVEKTMERKEPLIKFSTSGLTSRRPAQLAAISAPIPYCLVCSTFCMACCGVLCVIGGRFIFNRPVIFLLPGRPHNVLYTLNWKRVHEICSSASSLRAAICVWAGGASLYSMSYKAIYLTCSKAFTISKLFTYGHFGTL